MAVTAASTYRIQQITLTGTLTIFTPPTDVSVYEVWITSTSAFAFADKAAGPAFPVAASDTARVPVCVGDMDNETSRGLFLSGSGTAYLAWMGLPSVSDRVNS